MTTQLTIVGLGQIGASIGLALAEYKDRVLRVGHDKDPAIARQAEKIGAIDQYDMNLTDSVRKADLVLLCLPVDQISGAMQRMAQELRQGVVVMDTCPLKEAVAAWAKEYLPIDRHYVGLFPAINPEYLHETGNGLGAAHADLFHNGLIVITSPPHTDSKAIKLAADLTQMLGSNPLFADMAEIDGLVAATQVLPQILAAALLNATLDQPGWQEGRKVAGREYASASNPLLHLVDEQSLKNSALLNRENILRVLDHFQEELELIRSSIYAQDVNALDERLKHAHRSGQNWLHERKAAEWENEGSTPIEKRSFLSQLIGINPRPRPKPKSVS